VIDFYITLCNLQLGLSLWNELLRK